MSASINYYNNKSKSSRLTEDSLCSFPIEIYTCECTGGRVPFSLYSYIISLSLFLLLLLAFPLRLVSWGPTERATMCSCWHANKSRSFTLPSYWKSWRATLPLRMHFAGAWCGWPDLQFLRDDARQVGKRRGRITTPRDPWNFVGSVAGNARNQYYYYYKCR